MKTDDKIRNKNGVVVSLRDMGDGTSRIFMDDVKGDKNEIPITWQHEYFYTFTSEYKNEIVNEMALDDKEFQKIGEAVVARLLALSGRVK